MKLRLILFRPNLVASFEGGKLGAYVPPYIRMLLVSFLVLANFSTTGPLKRRPQLMRLLLKAMKIQKSIYRKPLTYLQT